METLESKYKTIFAGISNSRDRHGEPKYHISAAKIREGKSVH